MINLTKSPIPSIESPAQVVRNANHSEIHPYNWLKDTLIWRPKPKLDGTNGAIQICKNSIEYYSRGRKLSVTSDNMGFAAAMQAIDLSAVQATLDETEEIVWIGEWAGPGIQSRDAVSKIPKKEFFVFMELKLPSSIKYPLFEHKYSAINEFENCPFRIVPFLDSYVFDSLEDQRINELAATFQKEDPYIKQEFGISAPGEGVVLYPVYKNGFCRFSLSVFSQLLAKAKVVSHSERRGEKPVGPIIPVETVNAFIEKFLTEARLEKKFKEIENPSKEKTGEFLKLISEDIAKECATDLADSNLEWKQVTPALQKQAKNWFFTKING